MNDLIKRSDVEKMLSSIGGCDATEEWERGWDEAIDTALNELRKVKAADRWIQPILEGLENIAKKHPYKVIGNMDSYSQYNEAWQDCIDCVERMISEVFIEHQLQKDAINTIERQPKVGEWIPCSERLPDEEARQYIINNLDGIGYLYPCLLTYRSPNTEKVHVVRFYYDINMQCFVNHGEKMCEKARCIAWKPLPEPYKED